ncbi:MAG: SMC-Scp complex subunit ScpB [Minisyncoccia bacterium]|jgi:segregation and condensation protein B
MSDAPDQKLASLEALLFIHGEPLSYKKIASVLNLKKGEAESLAEELGKRLEAPGRGLHLVADKEKIQLATKPAFGKLLEDFVKDELMEELTPASLEALSIVAYLGPISRAKLEYLRGVNSIVILRSLMIRGLIERLPDPEHPSGFLYRPTFELMKHLGIAAEKDLPEYEKFQELLKVFETQSVAEPAPTAPAALPTSPPAQPTHE